MFLGAAKLSAFHIGITGSVHEVEELILEDAVRGVRIFFPVLDRRGGPFSSRAGFDSHFLLRLFAIQNFSIILPASVRSGISSSIAIPTRYGMQADNTGYIILKRHQQAEAAIASLPSLGIGSAIPGYLLAWAGFQKDTAVQPASVNTAIIACTIVIPAALFVVAAVIFGVLYPLGKKRLAEQTEQLQQLRESGVKID